jgi:DNA polymerase-3 subunit delta
VIVGTDDLVVKERAQELVREHTPPDAGDFGVEVIEGYGENVDSVCRILRNTLEAVQTMPFFGGGKVVWLKSTNILADTVTARAQDTVKMVEHLTDCLKAGLPADIHFILTAADVDKRRSAWLTFKSIANVEIYDAIDTTKAGWEEQVIPIVQERAADYAMRFDTDALHLFVMLAGEQSRQIENELEKLDLFLADRRHVTLEDVRQIVSESHRGVIWDLGNSIAQRDLPRALRLLDQLLYYGENAVGILLATIIPKIRSLFQTRELLETLNLRLNWQDRTAYGQLMKKEGGINGWSIFFAAKECGRFTAAELRSALEECLTANRRLVTTGLDPKIALNLLLLRILGEPPKKAMPKAEKTVTAKR